MRVQDIIDKISDETKVDDLLIDLSELAEEENKYETRISELENDVKERDEKSYLELYGADYSLTDNYRAGVSYQYGRVNPNNGPSYDRTAVSLSSSFIKSNFQLQKRFKKLCCLITAGSLVTEKRGLTTKLTEEVWISLKIHLIHLITLI